MRTNEQMLKHEHVQNGYNRNTDGRRRVTNTETNVQTLEHKNAKHITYFSKQNRGAKRPFGYEKRLVTAKKHGTNMKTNIQEFKRKNPQTVCLVFVFV